MATLSQEDLAAVRGCPLFCALTPRALRDLLDGCRVRRRAAGELVFRSGQSADRFFVILAGQVKVFCLSPRGEEQILHLYGPGETFGEAAMWAGGDYPAHAEVVRDARLLVVPQAALRRAIDRNADLAMGMLAGLSAKLREFAALIEDLSLREVPARLARVLLDESQRSGRRTFRLRQTKRQLAAQIGTVAETLSRALGKLKSAGLIDVRAAEITIRDPEALRSVAEDG